MIETTMIETSTIGFTKTSAALFFERLRAAGVRKIIDVRLHNTSQLAGFAKASDLDYFLKQICGAQYVHEPMLAPTDRILKAAKQNDRHWDEYQAQFLALMADRQIENRLQPDFFASGCLLCSEPTPRHCHRRLVCEYLNGKWGNTLAVSHL